MCQIRDVTVELLALEVIFEANLTGQSVQQAGTMAVIVRRAREEIERLRIAVEVTAAVDRAMREPVVAVAEEVINRAAQRQIDRNGS